MKIQTGTDIIEVKRIQEAIENGQEKFLNRIFTEKEIAYCEARKGMKYQHYAARFAAKEAVYKAISNLITDRSDALWKNIEVLNQEDGRPQINQKKLGISSIETIDVSLAHIAEYAIANVVIQIKEKE